MIHMNNSCACLYGINDPRCCVYRSEPADPPRDLARDVVALQAEVVRLREALEAATVIYEWDGGEGSKGYDAARAIAARRAFGAALREDA